MKSELRELIIWLQAFTNFQWIQDIQGALSVAAILEYMDIWEFVSDVVLQPDVYCGGLLSLANILQSQLTSIFLWFCCIIWRTWAPKKCQFFLCLAAHGRCWTADWLAKKGLPHLSHCPLCDQEEETIFQVGVASSPASWTLPFPSGRICGAQWLLLED